MSWDEYWASLIMLAVVTGAPVTFIVFSIMQWRTKYHSHRTRRRPSKSPWRK